MIGYTRWFDEYRLYPQNERRTHRNHKQSPEVCHRPFRGICAQSDVIDKARHAKGKVVRHEEINGMGAQNTYLCGLSPCFHGP